MKKGLLIGGGVLVVLAGGALVAPSFIDWNKYRDQIVTAAKDATGLDVAIGGNIDLAILPYPHVTLEKLSVTNPAFATAPLLTLDEAAVSVALLPLLSGKVEVNNVLLNKPIIHLEVAQNGANSWTLPKKQEEAAAPAATATPDKPAKAQAFSVNGVKIKDGALTYTDRRSGKTTTVNQINTQLDAGSLQGPYDVKGDLSYNDQSIQIEAKTGRMESDADSLSTQATIAVPAAGAKITFSGIVGLKGNKEIQGDAALETADLAQLMAVFTGKPGATAMKKPLAIQGLLTYAPEAAGYKNVKLSYGGAKATGSIGAINLAGGDKPLEITADLTADDQINLNDLLPPAAKKELKADAPKKDTTKAASLLPQMITLPMDIVAKVKIAAPSVKNNDVTLNSVVLDASWMARKGQAAISASLPPEGTARITMDLDFASASKSPQTGATILSGPTLSYSVALSTTDGARTALAFLPKDKVKDALPYLQGKTSLTGKGVVSENKVTLAEGAALLQGTNLGLSGSWEPKKRAGRDAVAVGVSADQLDVDKLMALGAPAKKQATAVQSTTVNLDQQKAQLRDTVAKINLPIDLAVNAALKNVTFKGTKYDAANILGSLDGGALTIKTFELKDSLGNSVLAAGSVADLNKLSGIDLSLEGKTPDAKKFLSGFDVDTSKMPDSLKSLDVLGAFKGQADKLAFTVNAKAMGGSVEASGALADLLGTPVVSDLTLRAKHPNYVEVMRLFNPKFKSDVALKKNMDVFASMKLDNKVYNLSELQATIGPATFTGDVKADVSGAKPSVTARLQASDVPLSDLLGQDTRKATASGAPIGGGGATKSSGERWSRAPINVEWMKAFNLDLGVTAKSISYGPWVFSNAAADVVLKDGVLDVKKVSGDMHGGKVDVSGKATAPAQAQGAVNVTGKADLKNVSLESFVSAFSGARLLKAKGDVSLNADIATVGASVSALINGLNGKGEMNGTNLVFEGFDLARLSRTLGAPSSSGTENITNILGATMKGGQTSFDTLASTLNITNGVIAINPLTLTGKDAVVQSPGTVNLPLWTIDMESTINLTEPADAPPLKVAFKGSLDNPGQTFGKSAMDSYVRGRVGSAVQDVLQKELGDKIDNPALQNLLGIAPKAKTPKVTAPKAATTTAPVAESVIAPAPAPVVEEAPVAPVVEPVAPAPEPVTAPAVEPVPAAEPAPQPQASEPTPEDMMKGLLDNVLQGQ